MLDEFVALVGCHRKHAVRLLKRGADRGVGSFGQDMREETEGGVAQHGGVAGEARSS